MLRDVKPPRSDVRVPGGVWGTCTICEEHKPLRQLGHVVADWMHTWVKAEGGGRIHGNYPSLGIDHAVTQDGAKHYILCDQCEDFMSRAEGYMRELMVGTLPRGVEVAPVAAGGVMYGGLRVPLIQRFLLGTALRAHAAKAAPFHNIFLPEDHLARVRLATRETDNGPVRDDDFMIVAMRYRTTAPGADPKAFVYAGVRPTEDGWPPVFWLFAAGWEWRLYLCGDEPGGAKGLVPFRLRPDVPFYVGEQDLIDHWIVRPLAERWPPPSWENRRARRARRAKGT